MIEHETHHLLKIAKDLKKIVPESLKCLAACNCIHVLTIIALNRHEKREKINKTTESDRRSLARAQ